MPLRQEVLADLQIVLVRQDGVEIPVNIVRQEVADPPLGILVKARVSLVNRLIFDYIQELQKAPAERRTNE